MNDSLAFLDARFRWETFAPFAHHFESTIDLLGYVRLPYVLLVGVAVELRESLDCGENLMSKGMPWNYSFRRLLYH